MTEIVIIARILPQEDLADFVRSAIDDLASASRDEAGNRGYDVFVSLDGQSEFLIHEIWADAEAIANHGRLPHMARFKETVKGKAQITVQTMAKP